LIPERTGLIENPSKRIGGVSGRLTSAKITPIPTNATRVVMPTQISIRCKIAMLLDFNSSADNSSADESGAAYGFSCFRAVIAIRFNSSYLLVALNQQQVVSINRGDLM
jgi:hypothetical protein